MAEKQIRTRKAIDEILEGFEEENRSVEEGEEGETEIEENARELRRLRPYQ